MDKTLWPTEKVVSSRRTLHFADLAEMLDDVRRMNACEHRSLGHWTLAQVCKHLADSINGSIDGVNLSRHRFKRWFLAKRMLAWTLENGIPPGITVDPHLTPPPAVDMATALAELQGAVRRYQTHPGKLMPHPLFGRMDRPTWDRLHSIHCAHHLSFIAAADGAEGVGSKPGRGGVEKIEDRSSKV